MSQSSFVCTQVNGFKFCYLTLIILFAHYKVLLSNTILFNINHLFAYTYSSIWLVDGTLTGTTTLGQSGLGSYANEGVYHKAPRLKLYYQMV